MGRTRKRCYCAERGGTVWGLTKLNLQIMAAFKGPKADACWVLEPHLWGSVDYTGRPRRLDCRAAPGASGSGRQLLRYRWNLCTLWKFRFAFCCCGGLGSESFSSESWDARSCELSTLPLLLLAPFSPFYLRSISEYISLSINWMQCIWVVYKLSARCNPALDLFFSLVDEHVCMALAKRS